MNVSLVKSLMKQGMVEDDAIEYSRIVMSEEISDDDKWILLDKIVNKWLEEHTH